jgi:predicted  nucleic acid-binding Zn-ribbon protein
MPQYKCNNCGQTFYDVADLAGNSCNNCDDGYVEIIEFEDEENGTTKLELQ